MSSHEAKSMTARLVAPPPASTCHRKGDGDRDARRRACVDRKHFNWDALDLAVMVHRGTVVKFEDKTPPAAPLAAA
jgi:hypothetical protein